ncbi:MULTISPECIES: zinc ABC transporter substrate-binding protein [Roseovarius]|uniref:zinc ABC transporter substrate-binding protein n=1 Tax=Roseovarius TaxID=74030 RepID=UPI00273D30AB|nr:MULTISPECIES: zinc ABC transporter substrate-binding protein [unclassified Roseovarius]
MSRNLVPCFFASTILAGPALAEVPQVAVDIAPVHSLVARVMDGVGAPALIVAPGASPHEYSLRPSEAAAMQDADLVFWIGPDLTPWLEDALGTLSGEAQVVGLMEADGTVALPIRENALFEAHDHGGHGDDGHDDHAGHDEHADDHDDHAHSDHDDDEHADHDHADHDHADHEGHETHEEDHAGHGHDHGHQDPHAWLSPDNAETWLNAIAAALSSADPDNAGAYFANAAEGREEIASLRAEIDGILEPARDGNFIVFHDAYQYFELAFDFPASGAISVSDASDPSPARVAEIQERVSAQGVTCVMSEPQFDPGIVAAVTDGADVKTGVMDPMGSDLEPGAGLYPQLLRNLATALAECL